MRNGLCFNLVFELHYPKKALTKVSGFFWVMKKQIILLKKQIKEPNQN